MRRRLAYVSAMRRCVIGLTACLAVLSCVVHATAQQGDTNATDAKPSEKDLSTAPQRDTSPAPQQDWAPTLVYLLEALKADPDAPPIWYQLGLKLSKMPGYQAPAIVWLDAYLLAVPNALHAAAIYEQLRQLRAASEPRTEEKLVDQLEAIALDTRGRLYAKQGQRELATADFMRVIRLDPTQDGAREALKRLSVAPRPPEKPASPAQTAKLPDVKPTQSTSGPLPKGSGRPSVAPKLGEKPVSLDQTAKLPDAKPTQGASGSPPMNSGCMRIVGTWKWAFGAKATFKRDGTFRMQARTGEGIGKWTCSDGKYYVLRHRNEVRMTMGEDGNTMTGVSSATRFLIRFTVHRKG